MAYRRFGHIPDAMCVCVCIFSSLLDQLHEFANTPSSDRQIDGNGRGGSGSAGDDERWWKSILFTQWQ